MNEQTREDLSALIDGELTPNETSKVVERLTGSEDLWGRWDRYHVIGDIIRGENIRSEFRQVACGVRDRLQDEPAILAPPRRARLRGQWIKPAAGTALAASVAAIALLAAPQLINREPTSSPVVAGVEETPPERLYAARPGTRWNLDEPDVESKLNVFLVNHQEYAATPSVKSMLPYVNFVSYDAGR